MNENFAKLLELAEISTKENVVIRDGLILYKNGDEGYYPIGKYNDKWIFALWIEMDDNTMDLYVRRDDNNEMDWLTGCVYNEPMTESILNIRANDLREVFENNYKIAKAVSAARRAFWNTYNKIVEA